MFDVDLPSQLTISMNPTPIAPAKVDWVEQKMQEYCKQGIAERVEWVRCACNVVLVWGT